MENQIDFWANWVTIITLPVAVFGFYIAIRQLILYKKTEEARFWLEIRALFKQHDEVHKRLRDPQDWRDNQNNGPNTNDEWAKVESYMGTFEVCYHLIESKLIDLDFFKRQYGYRIQNLISNLIIRQRKLRENAQGWTDFISLVDRLGLTMPDDNR